MAEVDVESGLSVRMWSMGNGNGKALSVQGQNSTNYQPHSSSSNVWPGAEASFPATPAPTCAVGQALTGNGSITSPNAGPPLAVAMSSSSNNDAEEDDWRGVVDWDAVELDVVWVWCSANGLYDDDARGGDASADAIFCDKLSNSTEALF